MATVVASLQKKLDEMITLKVRLRLRNHARWSVCVLTMNVHVQKEMEDREKLKIDFDSAVRKVRQASRLLDAFSVCSRSFVLAIRSFAMPKNTASPKMSCAAMSSCRPHAMHSPRRPK